MGSKVKQAKKNAVFHRDLGVWVVFSRHSVKRFAIRFDLRDDDDPHIGYAMERARDILLKLIPRTTVARGVLSLGKGRVIYCQESDESPVLVMDDWRFILGRNPYTDNLKLVTCFEAGDDSADSMVATRHLSHLN